MKIKLESSKYDFKTKEEEANFKLKIKKSFRHRCRKVRIECWFEKHQQTMS